MPTDPCGFSTLMALIVKGDQQAAAQLFQLFKDDVLGIIRSRLNRHKRLRSRLDAEDVAQNVWFALFAKPAKCQDFTTPKYFLKYVTGIAHHHVDKAMRKHLDTQKRDLHRIHHLSDPSVSSLAGAVTDPHLTPYQRMVAADERDQWLSSLAAKERQVVSMILNGFSHQEMATAFVRSKRSIERIVTGIHEKLPSENIPHLGVVHECLRESV